MKKITIVIAAVITMLICTAAVHAYNVVELPETMTLADALEIYDTQDITSATVSDINDGCFINLSNEQIEEFYYSASRILLYRKINPTPFRGKYVNFFTSDGVKSFGFNSGVQIGMYGKANYICYEMQDYDLSKFMYLCSLYEESTEKQNISEVYVNTEVDFLKMPEDLWAQPIIEEAASRTLLPYQLTDKYSSNISREEFCVLIGNFIAVISGYSSLEAYMNEKNPIYNTDNFVDCAGRDKSIDILFSLGIVNGRGDEYFDPDGAINRQEAAKLLTETAEQFKHIESSFTPDYDDYGLISPWAEFYVSWVTEKGIMGGIDERHFEPLGSYTVQQAIATVSRLYNICAD